MTYRDITTNEFRFIFNLLIAGEAGAASAFIESLEVNMKSILYHLLPLTALLIRERAVQEVGEEARAGDWFVAIVATSSESPATPPPLHAQAAACAANEDIETVVALLDTVRDTEEAQLVISELFGLAVGLSHIIAQKEAEK